MYFSMHTVMHCDSVLDNEEPGFATHLLKQFLLILCAKKSTDHTLRF